MLNYPPNIKIYKNSTVRSRYLGGWLKSRNLACSPGVSQNASGAFFFAGGEGAERLQNLVMSDDFGPGCVVQQNPCAVSKTLIAVQLTAGSDRNGNSAICREWCPQKTKAEVYPPVNFSTNINEPSIRNGWGFFIW